MQEPQTTCPASFPDSNVEITRVASELLAMFCLEVILIACLAGCSEYTFAGAQGRGAHSHPNLDKNVIPYHTVSTTNKVLCCFVFRLLPFLKCSLTGAWRIQYAIYAILHYLLGSRYGMEIWNLEIHLQ